MKLLLIIAELSLTFAWKDRAVDTDDLFGQIEDTLDEAADAINEALNKTADAINEALNESGINITENLLGGAQDTYGCYTSAGYTWCDALSKCMRVWEEDCIDNSEDQDDSLIAPGADEDEHGCIGSAGYVWCQNLEDCVRRWELVGEWFEVCEYSTESPTPLETNNFSDSPTPSETSNFPDTKPPCNFTNNGLTLESDSSDSTSISENGSTESPVEVDETIPASVDDPSSSSDDGYDKKWDDPSSSSDDGYDKKKDDDCNKGKRWCKGCVKNFIKTRIFFTIVVAFCFTASCCVCMRVRRNRQRVKRATKIHMLGIDACSFIQDGPETTARKEGETTSSTGETTTGESNAFSTVV